MLVLRPSFCAQILSFIPRILLSPAIFMLMYVPAAYPVIHSNDLYKVLLCTQLTCTSYGVFLTFVVAEKNLQVSDRQIESYCFASLLTFRTHTHTPPPSILNAHRSPR